ncbi:MAG TPA: hypothetical protein VIK64_09205 [Anaerolineales bacterium]|jgi:hypothetical protein
MVWPYLRVKHIWWWYRTAPGTITLLSITVVFQVSLYIIYGFQSPGRQGFPLDDAWIHLVFARNIARGSGFSYNPGEMIAGSTAPLWTLLLAGSEFLPGGAIYWSRLFGVLFLLLAGYLVYRIALLFKVGWGIALLLGLTAVSTSRLVWASLSGMETTLFISLSLLGIYSSFSSTAINSRYHYLATFSIALATLTRPEGIVIFLVLWIKNILFLENREGGSKINLRKILVLTGHAGTFTLILLPSMVFNLQTANSLFPNTFAALTGPNGLIMSLQDRNFAEMVRSLTVYPIKAIPSLLIFFAYDNLLLLIVSLFVLWNSLQILRKQEIKLAILRNTYKGSILLITLFALPLSRTIIVPNQDINYHMGRYLALLSPLFVLVIGIGLMDLAAHKKDKFLQIPKSYLMVIVFFGCAISFLLLLFGEKYLSPVFRSLYQSRPHVIPFEDRWPVVRVYLLTFSLGIFITSVGTGFLISRQWRTKLLDSPLRIVQFILIAAFLLSVSSTILNVGVFAGQVKNIQEMQVQMGRWAATSTPQDAYIATNDIGAIAYFSERRILDVVGLVSPEVIPYLRSGERGLFSLLASKRPHYIIVYPNWYPHMARMQPLFVPVYSIAIEPNLICGGRMMVVYRANWEYWPEFEPVIDSW